MQYNIDTLVHHFRKKGPVVLLESQSSDHPASRFTYLAALPTASIKATGDKVLIKEENEERIEHTNPWDALSRFQERHSDWMFGYFGYDLKNSIEELQSQNNDSIKAPDLYFMIPGLLLEIDNSEGRIDILKGEIPAGLAEGSEIHSDPQLGALDFSVSRERYLEIIEEAQHRIAEGDFYEINLSHQLHAGFTGNTFRLYERMKKIGPVPFGAYMQFDDFSICSMSPERFLKKVGNSIFSQPIKGTVKRGQSSEEDKSLISSLRNSVKNRAENLMIVDLVRNDLSRIAEKGSVEVSKLFEIQTFGTVHQMVSTVEAQSVEENPVRIIKACYPMGSMTGAPKISAMKAIEELENYKRGIYSGAIGYIKPNADFDFNVVIRTAIIKKGDLYYSVGGAITGDSDPADEWEETLVKARALTALI